MAMKKFTGPIPGMSLTQKPKNAPWENPPQVTDPVEALDMHINRLMDPDRMESVLHLVEVEGITIKTLVTGLLRAAVANGIHSIDVSLIVGPAIHEFIKRTADAVGAEYDEGLDDGKGAEARQEMVRQRAKKMLREAGVKIPDVEVPEEGEMATEEASQEVNSFEGGNTPEEAMPEGEAMLQEPAGNGLMSRRAV